MNINYNTYWSNIKYFNRILLRILLNNRLKINKIISENIEYNKKSNVLDIGSTPSLEQHQNVFLHLYPWKDKVTCISNLDCKVLNKLYPKITILKGDGRKLELKNNLFDLVHSNAVIEHVGSFENQIKFVKECVRVSKSKICINTPNRFFPIDSHTKIPLIHMFPKRLHRFILRIFGLNYFSLEENLNLVSKKDLIKICKKLNLKNYKIINYYFLGFISNFILIIEK